MGAQNGKTSNLPPAAELVHMLDMGATYDEIADDYGYSPETVRQHVYASGLLASKKAQQEALRESRAADDDDVIDLSALVPRGDLSWQDRSLCAQTDPEEFFPEKGGTTRHAKAICAVCPVQAECLDYAIANDERFGIFGGLSERERREVKKALEVESGAEQLACDRCPATFIRSSDLARHARTHDRQDLALPCTACDYVATTKAAHTIHINRQHPELRTAS
jgi:WhiB family redox-sensing transcriptional regulator